MRSVSLTSAKTGIQRLRDKAGARPDSLYDLVNGWVTAALSVKPRPGTYLEHELPAGTVGLTAFAGKLYVYASSVIAMTDSRFELAVLKHPTLPEQTLVAVHFAEPFLGYLYVVGEFQNGDVFHYWLQPVEPWTAETNYCLGDVIEPTTPNGYSYRATRIGPPNQTWLPNETRNIGDLREPSVANCFYYEIVDILGVASPIEDVPGASVEPTWIAEDGAIVYEDVGGTNETPAAPIVTDPGTGTTTPPESVLDRYFDRRIER